MGKINSGLVRGPQQPEVKETTAKLGLEAVTSTPQGFADIVKGDAAKFSRLIKDAGIRID